MIELTDWLRAELTRRADQEAPQEAVGLISRPSKADTRGRQPISLWSAENAAEEPETSFLIAPDEQAAILRQIWGRGEDLVGIFHSHPSSSPDPSERDRAVAAGIQSMRPAGAPPLTWVIVGSQSCPHCEDGAECCGNYLGTGECCAALYGTDRLVPCRSCGGAEVVVDFWIGELP